LDGDDLTDQFDLFDLTYYFFSVLFRDTVPSILIIFRQKTPTQLVGWGMNGAGFEHIVLQPLMRLLHNCQHSSFCSKSFLWKGIDPN